MDEDVVVLIDAYKPQKGDFPRSFTPQIALYSHGTKDAATLSQNPFVLDTIGECEVKNTGVYSFPGGDEDNLIFKVATEGLLVVHLGKITKKIDDSLLEKIGDPDILILPVGGKGKYLSPEDAAAVVSAIEPRIVIPVGYQCDTESDVLPLSEFIKESGLKSDVTDKKLIIKKKDLPAEETKLMVLEKNY